MVCLVNHDRIGLLGDSLEPGREITGAGEVSVAKHGQVRKVCHLTRTTHVGEVSVKLRRPNSILRSLGRKKNDLLAFLHHQPFNEHQADKRFTETDPVTKQCSTVLAGDLHHRPVRLLLISVKPAEHLGPVLFPVADRWLLVDKQLVQRAGVDVERGVLVDVASHRGHERLFHVNCIAPVPLVPRLELGDFAAALKFDIQLYVLVQAWNSEVRRTYECLRSDDVEFAVRDVCLGMKLVLVVDGTLNLAGLHCLDNRLYAGEKRIGSFVVFEPVVDDLLCARSDGFEHRFVGAMGDFVTHQDADFVKFLPVTVELKQRADLEVAGGDVEFGCEFTPFAQVLNTAPAAFGVINDEQRLVLRRIAL